MTKDWARGLILPLLLILYCCSKPTAPESHPPIQPDGASLNLQVSHRQVLGNLDQVGSQAVNTANVTIPPGDVTLAGWAVDGQAASPAGGVDVVVDGNPYKARYGLDRPDVAKALKVAAYEKSGFSFVLHAALFSKGKHSVLVRVISADQKSYIECFPLTIDIEG